MWRNSCTRADRLRLCSPSTDCAVAARPFRGCARRNTPVHLIRRNLHEPAEPGCFARGLEQHERAEDVRVDELASRHQRSIDVRLGREVNDEVRVADKREAMAASAMSPCTN